MALKLFLDDERPTPEGWTHCRWPADMIAYLENPALQIDIISLDHDLGSDEHNGYDVLLWIEEQVGVHGFVPPTICLHTSNSSAREKMQRAVVQIQRLAQANRKEQQHDNDINHGT